MKTCKLILAAALVGLAALSCNKEPNGTNPGGNTPSGSNTPIELKASTTAPEMNVDTQTSDVLTLSWNATTNMGTGARIAYSLLFDNKGGDFESAYEIPAEGTEMSATFTADRLNTIIKDEFGVENGESIELDVVVYATISSTEVDDVISNRVTLTLTAFEPKPTALYMIGSATAAGWDLGKAVAMDPIEGEDGGFTWSGELFGGELKFLVNPVDWIPSYNKGADDSHLVLRDHYWDDPTTGERVDDESLPHVDTPDDKFIIAEQGNYKIVLSIEKLTITITKTGGPKYFTMCIFGSALEKVPVAMTREGYAFIGFFESNGNYIHFTADVNNNKDFFYAAEEEQALDKTAVSQTTYYEWHVPAGLYHVGLFAKEGKEAVYFNPFTPYETVYLIGSACDAGWDIANALPMTNAGGGVQTWTGTLKAGELKFTCDKSTDWFGAWYLSSEAGKAPAGEEEPLLFVDKSLASTATMGIKEIDKKWNITDEGTYEITLDQTKETVIIKKK
ncbi:MAG: SusF/SusE family outer membrane protein [Bacteroidales bacterium]|nr:SusF/SusE family outer membrane protein [Bacteroidales bacterium]